MNGPKSCGIYTKKYCIAIKKVIQFAAMYNELEDIMSEIR